MQNRYYTYAHYTEDTNELFYIGKGSIPKHRQSGTQRAKSSKGRNKYWQRKVKKHGFRAEVLAYWNTEQEALDHEILLISCFKDLKVELCNLTDGGEGMSGMKHTEDFKKAASIRMTGNKYCVGRKLSDERVEQLRNLHKGIPKTTEHKLNLSKSRKGLKVPVIWKKVICTTTDIIFNSVTEAAQKTNRDASHIVKCCKGKIKQIKGLSFQYV
jgi:hypothetical protein